MKTRASKIGSVLLTLSLIIGMFAGMGVTAWAADINVTLTITTAAPKTGANPDFTTDTLSGAGTPTVEWSDDGSDWTFNAPFVGGTVYYSRYTYVATNASTSAFDAAESGSGITISSGGTVDSVEVNDGGGDSNDTLIFIVEWPPAVSDVATLSTLAISAGT